MGKRITVRIKITTCLFSLHYNFNLYRFAIINIPRNRVVLSFSISMVNFIFLWKQLSANNTLSMYSDLSKQYLLSKTLFDSFILSYEFSRTRSGPLEVS